MWRAQAAVQLNPVHCWQQAKERQAAVNDVQPCDAAADDSFLQRISLHRHRNANDSQRDQDINVVLQPFLNYIVSIITKYKQAKYVS